MMKIKSKNVIEILKNNKKIINITLIFLIILNFYLVGHLIIQEEDVIKVNKNNRELVMNMLDGFAESRNASVFFKKIFTLKVGIGRGFHCGQLHIYYPIGGKIINYGEGDFWIGDVEDYIRENGTSLDKVAIFILKINLILLILEIILKKTIFKQIKESHKNV